MTWCIPETAGPGAPAPPGTKSARNDQQFGVSESRVPDEPALQS